MFHRRKMLAPINSIKHYINNENASTASAAKRSIVLVTAVAQNAVSSTDDVVEGSIVKAIFIEHWAKSGADAGADTKFQFILEKVPAGQSSISFANMNTLMGYNNKKNVLFFSQGVIGDLTTQAIPIVRQWFKIPKGKQRFGLGDTLVATLSATAFAIDNCGFAVYKEYK